MDKTDLLMAIRAITTVLANRSMRPPGREDELEALGRMLTERQRKTGDFTIGHMPNLVDPWSAMEENFGPPEDLDRMSDNEPNFEYPPRYRSRSRMTNFGWGPEIGLGDDVLPFDVFRDLQVGGRLGTDEGERLTPDELRAKRAAKRRQNQTLRRRRLREPD